MIFWIAKAAGFGETWEDLQKNSLIRQGGRVQAQICEDFLRHLRIRLHFMVGRREDRLLFDYQNNLAGKYGYESNEAKRASEQLMQVYYRHAKTVTLLNTILLQNMGRR